MHALIEQLGSSRTVRTVRLYPTRAHARLALDVMEGNRKGSATVREPDRIGWTNESGKAVLWTVAEVEE